MQEKLFLENFKKKYFIILADNLITVNIQKLRTQKFLTKWPMQTVQTQIRLLLQDQSKQGPHCLPFRFVFLKNDYIKTHFRPNHMWNKMFETGHLPYKGSPYSGE